MRNQKGFSFIELLAVIVLVALLIIVIVPNIFMQIDRARADTILAEARAVSTAGHAVMIKFEGSDISDLQLTEGLTGTFDSAAFPKQTEISKQLNAYLAPVIKLSTVASEEEGKVSFFLVNGQIKKVIYEKIVGNKLRIATLDDGEGSVKSQKIVKKKE